VRGELQTNNSAIFSIQHSSENTALRTQNKVLLGICITNFESLKVDKMNNLSTRNALSQLKHSHMKKITLRRGS